MKNYRLTVLMHPQSSKQEQEKMQSIVQKWVEKNKGGVRDVKSEEKFKLSYPIRNEQYAVHTNMVLSLPALETQDLTAKLSREKKVLRYRINHYQEEKEKKSFSAALEEAKKSEEAKQREEKVRQKTPAKNLDEKIEKALDEEVL